MATLLTDLARAARVRSGGDVLELAYRHLRRRLGLRDDRRLDHREGLVDDGPVLKVGQRYRIIPGYVADPHNDHVCEVIEAEAPKSVREVFDLNGLRSWIPGCSASYTVRCSCGQEWSWDDHANDQGRGAGVELL